MCGSAGRRTDGDSVGELVCGALCQNKWKEEEWSGRGRDHEGKRIVEEGGKSRSNARKIGLGLTFALEHLVEVLHVFCELLGR